jgi:hypothetical protein
MTTVVAAANAGQAIPLGWPLPSAAVRAASRADFRQLLAREEAGVSLEEASTSAAAKGSLAASAAPKASLPAAGPAAPPTRPPKRWRAELRRTTTRSIRCFAIGPRSRLPMRAPRRRRSHRLCSRQPASEPRPLSRRRRRLARLRRSSTSFRRSSAGSPGPAMRGAEPRGSRLAPASSPGRPSSCMQTRGASRYT